MTECAIRTMVRCCTARMSHTRRTTSMTAVVGDSDTATLTESRWRGQQCRRSRRLFESSRATGQHHHRRRSSRRDVAGTTTELLQADRRSRLSVPARRRRRYCSANSFGRCATVTARERRARRLSVLASVLRRSTTIARSSCLQRGRAVLSIPPNLRPRRNENRRRGPRE